MSVQWNWHCRSCGKRLEVYLDHVDPGPRPEHGHSPQCPGTFKHPRSNCVYNGRTLNHKQATLRVVNDAS